MTSAGMLAGDTSQAAVVVVTPPTAGAPGGAGVPVGATYRWTISGGRLTSDPTLPTISFAADAPGTVTLSVVVTSGTTTQSASIDVMVISPALAGTITAPARVATNSAPITAAVPPAQNGDRTFRWTAAGGGAAIMSGQGTERVTVRPGAPGLLELTCQVTLQRLATVPVRSFVVVQGDGPPTTLAINSGSGGGTYPAGSRVDVFANPPSPGQVFERWTGDTAVLGGGALAATLPHAIATVPTTPATLTATYKAAPAWTPTTVNNFNPIAEVSPDGTTLIHHIPANAQGVVFLLHDAGGTNTTWFSGAEHLLLTRDLVAAGFGVAALNSVNRAAGTWAVQAALANNPDSSTLGAALDRFARDGQLPAGKPVFLLGVGAGGDAAGRYAQQLATAGRPIKGAILFFATGGATLAVTSRVPQFFALAAHDDVLGPAGNADVRGNSQLLVGRGVPTAVITNAAAPVYSNRLRALGSSAPFTASDAEAVWTALKNAELLDANNYPKAVPSRDAVRAALPTAYQSRAADVATQLAVAYGAREFYSEAAPRVLAFLNARVSDAPAPAPGRLVNLSARTKVAHLGDSFALGFSISGQQPARLLIRGIGPALVRFGLSTALPAPRLEVNRGDTLVAANEGWERAPNAAEITAAAASVGAFALTPGDLDAALLLTLQPGTYTATIRGLGGTVGDVLAEVYDVSKNATRLTNLSTLARITSEGELLIPGIVIAGNNPRTLMVRAVGPGLAEFGMPADALLGDPRITILNAAGQTVAANNNWAQAGAATLSAAFPAVGAFPLRTASDAALLNALPAGNYTLQAGAMPIATLEPPPDGQPPRAIPNAVGSVLVEVYEVP